MPQPSPMPMQQPATGPATEPEAPPVLDFEPATDTTALVAEAEIDTTTPPGLDLDLSAEQAAAAEEATADTGLEFDLDTDRAATEASAAAEEVPLPDTAELSAEELGTAALEQEEPLGLGEEPVDNVADFDITEGGEKEPALADTGELEFEADAGVALETPPAEAPADTGPEDAQQWDETATKLDLAKAYVDMGDAEGARSILDEVLAEGNEDQKKQAAELAAQIA
ncbi:MAG: FimV/HubP family polar landmark protein [Acidiferrobacterales bacterium]